MTTIQFDLTDGIRLRDEGLARATQRDNRHQALEWLQKPLRILYGVRSQSGSLKAFCTADDAVWLLKTSPHAHLLHDGSNSVWLGAVFRKRGWVKTGIWVPSCRASNRARVIPGWRPL